MTTYSRSQNQQNSNYDRAQERKNSKKAQGDRKERRTKKIHFPEEKDPSKKEKRHEDAPEHAYIPGDSENENENNQNVIPGGRDHDKAHRKI